MLKKIVLVLSRCIRSVIPFLVLLTYAWLPVTRASDTLLLDKVIATVNQELILHSDLEEVCKQVALEGKEVDKSVEMDLLRELVLNKIFLAKAAILDDVKIPKARIQRACNFRIASLIRQYGSEEKLVQAAHQSIYHIKKGIKKRLKAEYLASCVYQHLTQHIVVRPAEVKAYFNALVPHSRPYYPTSVEVHQLVIYPKASAARQEAVKSKLLQLKQLLLDGVATFSDLAKQHSDDPHSASKGEIGWVPLGALAPAYESAALSLKPGEISDPIASEFGFHLVELIGRNKDQYNTRHILKVVEPTEEEIRLTERELKAIKDKIVAGTLTFEAAVQQYSEDKETVAQGGLITTNHQGGDLLPGRLVSVEDLDPEVYFAIDGLEAGTVSAPQYMGRPCRSGWRLLYLKQKVEAHPMNLAQDYQRIHYDLLQQKKKKAVDAWIQKAKSAFVISFSPEYRAVEQLL